MRVARHDNLGPSCAAAGGHGFEVRRDHVGRKTFRQNRAGFALHWRVAHNQFWFGQCNDLAEFLRRKFERRGLWYGAQFLNRGDGLNESDRVGQNDRNKIAAPHCHGCIGAR